MSDERSAVELWVRDDLRRRWDATLGEPVPQDLMALLDGVPTEY